MSSRSPELPAALLETPIAHRGLHRREQGVIENSRAAAEAAIAAGYGIEIDVQASADGEAMVFHDDELLRLTDAPGLIHDYTAAALGRIAEQTEVVCTTVGPYAKHGGPLVVLPASQVLRFALPEYIEEDPALAANIDALLALNRLIADRCEAKG